MTVAYLSRIWINPLRQQARRLLADPQAMHAAVLGGIPSQPVEERVLWRLDVDEPRRPGLVVLTASCPSWEHLVEQAGWPSADPVEDPQAVVRPYGPLLDRIQAGERFAFRLTANPTQSTKKPEHLTTSQNAVATDGTLARSTRVGHRTVAHQLRWFTERTERWGFSIPGTSASESMGEEVPDLRVVARERRSFARGRKDRVTIQIVTYEGHLVVADPAMLRERMLAGIGPAKAYGCGLLTLAPAHPSVSAG